MYNTKSDIVKLNLKAKKLEKIIEFLNKKFENKNLLLKKKKSMKYFKCKILSLEEVEKKLDMLDNKKQKFKFYDSLKKEISKQKKQKIPKNELSVIFIKNKNEWNFYSFEVMKKIFEKKLFDNNLNIIKPEKIEIKTFNKYIRKFDDVFFDNLENPEVIKAYYLIKNNLFDKLKFYKYRNFFPNRLQDEKFEYGIKTFEYNSFEDFLEGLKNLNHEKITSTINKYKKKVKEINKIEINNNFSIFKLL